MSRFGLDARAFGAAALKEWRTLRRYPTLILGLTFWPLMLPAAWVLMGRAYSGDDPAALEAFAARSGTPEIAGFIFVGFCMYMWLSVILWGPGTALRAEQVRGSLEAMFVTPASRLVILFGPPTAHLFTIAWDLFFMGLLLWLLFGVVIPLEAALGALFVSALAIPALYGIGALFASAVLRLGEVGPVVQIVRGTFVLACGITFPIALLPAWAQTIAVTLPPTHIVEATRQVVLSDRGLVGVVPELALTAALGAMLCAFAVLAFRANERDARRTGMLGRY